MGSNYVPGEKKDLYNKSVQRTVLCMGRKQDAVEDVPCGNTVALVGLDAFIQKNATLCDQTATDAFPIKAMKFSVRHLPPDTRSCHGHQYLSCH
jgi:elongation factor 2